MDKVRENEQELQDMIQKLGNTIVNALPQEWECAVIGYFIVGENDVSHFQFHMRSRHSNDYIDIVNESWNSERYDEAIVETQKICKRIRNICTNANDQWTAMTFSLTADGAFDIDFSYDKVEDYNAAFILKWQSQYLI